MKRNNCLYPKESRNNKSKVIFSKILVPSNINNDISFDEMADLMIDSFNQGKVVGEKNFCLKTIQKVKSDVNDIISIVDKFTKEVNSNENILKSAFIRFSFPNSYKLLFSMDENAYFNDCLSEPIYERSWQISDESEEKGKHLEILFIPKTESLNEKSIVADGYFHMY